MQLQKQLSRRVGNKEYPKWVLVIPPSKIKEAGLKEGEELDIRVKEKQLLIKKKEIGNSTQ